MQNPKTVVNYEVSDVNSSFMRISLAIQGLPIALKIVMPIQNQMLRPANRPHR